MRKFPNLVRLLAALVLLCSTSCDNGTGGTNSDGGGGGLNQCPAFDLGTGPATADMSMPGPCGGATCVQGQVCLFNTCIPTPAACQTDTQCQGDTYCQAGQCIPYGVGPRGASNPQCKRAPTVGVFSPRIRCRWSGPAAGDPFPTHKTVLSSPVVVDLDLDKDPQTRKPSIIFTSGNCAKSCQEQGGTCYGVIRVIDGDTCAPQFSMAGPDAARIIEQVPPSVADLNGDGRADIVVQNQAGGITAFTFDPALQNGKGDFKQLFHNGSAVNPTGCTWAALSIHDLNNDGVPEIIQASPKPTAYNNMGQLIHQANVNTDTLPGGAQLQPVLADIDGDGSVELLTGRDVLRFNAATRQWVTVNSAGVGLGLTGLADFGTFGANAANDDRTKLDGIPEIVLITVEGRVRVQTAAGRVIFNVVHPGTIGGSPTIADFDKDGRVEIGVAGAQGYAVFDPDCRAGASATVCPSGTVNGILWQKATQDSSGFTGSTVFDFDGDGRPKVVYADECFLRIYDGASGEVYASIPNRSQTYYEGPVVADTNGDLQADIVVAQNELLGCPASDPTFAGVRCQASSDCPGTSTCTRAQAADPYGRCSCTSDAQCGGGFLTCQAALQGGATRYCRTNRDPAATSSGVIVVSDSRGRWVPTRPIWNQFVYTVTNVDDNGAVPKTSDWKPNWREPGLNNFLQNVQGALDLQGAADLTIRPEPLRSCAASKVTLAAQVCNRGTLASGAAVPVVFRDGATTLCTTTTNGTIASGTCQRVTCDATISGAARTLDLNVDAQAVNECDAGNNGGRLTGVACFQCTAVDSSQCQAGGQVCDVSKNACAPCSKDAECGVGAVCTSGKCQAPAPECSAADASACVAKGLVCNATIGRCAFCKVDAECPMGLTCNLSCGGVCQAPQTVKNPRFVGGCSTAPGGAPAGAMGFAVLCLVGMAGLFLRRRARRLGLMLGAGLLFLPMAVRAQEPPRVNAQTFKPVLMPEGLITVEGSRTPRSPRPILGFLLEYAYRPLRLLDGDNTLVANTIPRMLTAHLYAGFGITRWLAVAASLPVVVYQDYDERTPKTFIPTAPSQSGIGDLRLMVKWRLLNNEDGGFGIAFAPQVTFPTGGAFRSDDAYGFEPRFALDWRSRGGLIVAANLGFLARTSDQELFNAKVSHQARYGAGVYVPVGAGFGLAGEVMGGTSVKKGADLYSQLEAYGAARWVGKSGINVNIGGGAALIQAVGSPQFRVFAGLGYLPFGKAAAAPADRDGDGIPDALDRCPDQAEDRDGFQDEDGCPDPDNDGDGVLDVDDKCPNVPGVRENAGCPDVDSDGDGVVDRLDKCPKEPGLAELSGCPDPDTDKDGIVDRLDKCPKEPGPKDNAGCPDTDQDQDGVVDRKDLCPTEAGPAPTGCPKKKFIEVTQDKINLREQVRFDTDKATIKPGSYPLLDEVVKVLTGRKDLLLRIEGHTDSSGKLQHNMELSEQRAAAVRDYLVKGGVGAERLVAKGYGPTRPIADNGTKAGREKNRRTEFFLVSREEFEAAKAR